jgi:hypothetical protein
MTDFHQPLISISIIGSIYISMSDADWICQAGPIYYGPGAGQCSLYARTRIVIDDGMAIKSQVVAVIGVDYLDRLFYDDIPGQVYKSGPIQRTSRMRSYHYGTICDCA